MPASGAGAAAAAADQGDLQFIAARGMGRPGDIQSAGQGKSSAAAVLRLRNLGAMSWFCRSRNKGLGIRGQGGRG